MLGSVISYDDELCIKDSESNSRYPIHSTSLLALNDYQINTNKQVKSVTYCIFNHQAVILSLVEC